MAQIPSLKLPSFRLPSIDLPHISVPKVSLPSIPKVNLPSLHSIDLTNADVRKVLDSEIVERAKTVVGDVKEVAFTAIGFGVLAFQKAQVRQREIREALFHSAGDSSESPAPAA